MENKQNTHQGPFAPLVPILPCPSRDGSPKLRFGEPSREEGEPRKKVAAVGKLVAAGNEGLTVPGSEAFSFDSFASTFKVVQSFSLSETFDMNLNQSTIEDGRQMVGWQRRPTFGPASHQGYEEGVRMKPTGLFSEAKQAKPSQVQSEFLDTNGSSLSFEIKIPNSRTTGNENTIFFYTSSKSRNILRFLFVFFFYSTPKNQIPLVVSLRGGSPLIGDQSREGKFKNTFTDSNKKTSFGFSKFSTKRNEFKENETIQSAFLFMRSFVRKTLESFPTVRIFSQKIQVIPLILCIIPYIVFLGIRQSCSVVTNQQLLSTKVLFNSNSATSYVYGTGLFCEAKQAHLHFDVRAAGTAAQNLGLGAASPPQRNAKQAHFASEICATKSIAETVFEIVKNKKLQFFETCFTSEMFIAAQKKPLALLDTFALRTPGLLGIPSIGSKLCVVWAIQQIAAIRPQRKMTQKAEQSAGETRILFPNEMKRNLESLEGLTGFLPILQILTESIRAKNTSNFLERTKENFFRAAPFARILPPSGRKGSSTKLTSIHSYAPKGYLFVGPPGTGKTCLAQALAKKANVPLLCVSASEIQKQIEIGTRIGALRLRSIFETARQYAPCILFFDEIDAIGKTRGESFGTSDNQLLTEFFIQMDSFSVNEGFVVIGTTNFLSQLDSAFIRSGRFDRILGLNLPSKQVRKKIIQLVLPHKIQNIPAAKVSNGMSGETFAKREERKGDVRAASPPAEKTRNLVPNSIPWNYFAYYTADFSQAHLSRFLNESFLYVCKNRIEKNEKLLQRKESFSFFSSELFVPEHSFESLQHGLNRIQTHRKNFGHDFPSGVVQKSFLETT